MKIGLDLDGVVYDWHFAMYTYCRAHKNIMDMSYTDFWLTYFPSLSKEEQRFLIGIPYLYESCPITDNVLKTLEKIASIGEIYYITSRDKSLTLVTERFLRKNKVPCGGNLILSDDKATYAKLLKLNFFVDDNVDQVKSLSRVVTTFLYSQVWNRGYQESFPTVSSLNHFYSVIRR